MEEDGEAEMIDDEVEPKILAGGESEGEDNCEAKSKVEDGPCLPNSVIKNKLLCNLVWENMLRYALTRFSCFALKIRSQQNLLTKKLVAMVTPT